MTGSYHRVALPALPEVLAVGPPNCHGPAPAHLLGSPSHVVRRICAALFGLHGHTKGARVPLATLGAALVAPTGAVFDDHDEMDRLVLARLLVAFADRFSSCGWSVADVPPEPGPGHVVTVSRCPLVNDREPRQWPTVASRWVLARWSRRAGPIQPVPPTEVDDAGPEEPPLDGRALVERIKAHHRAAGLPWPPPVVINNCRRETR